MNLKKGSTRAHAGVTKTVMLCLALSLVLSACGGSGKEQASGTVNQAETRQKQEGTDDAGKEQSGDGADASHVDVEIVSGTPAKDAPKDQGEPEVWIQGKAVVEADKIVVSGMSNLVPGVEVDAEMDATGYTMVGYREDTETAEDGSFTMELKKPDIKEGVLDVTISFTPSEQSAEISNYGARGEKMTGTFIHQFEEDGEIYRKAVTYMHIDAKANAGSEWNMENPVGEKPADYGDPKVWIKPEVKAENGFYLIRGKSNLLEGTEISADVDIPNYIHFGYGESTEILPDGSFQLKVKQPKKDVGTFYLVLEVEPDEDLPKTVREAYGQRGEKFAGDLVKTEQEDKGPVKYIEMKMKVDPSK